MCLTHARRVPSEHCLHLNKETGLSITKSTSTILSMNRTWWISTIFLEH